MENYQNKNYYQPSSTFSCFSTQLRYTVSYTNFLRLKSTNKNKRNIIYKIKSYFHSLWKGLGIPLIVRKLDCCILQRVELESRRLFSKKYFIFFKRFLNLSESIWQGQLTGEWGEGGRGWEKTVQKVEFSQYKTFDKKMLLNSSWCVTVFSITFILRYAKAYFC